VMKPKLTTKSKPCLMMARSLSELSSNRNASPTRKGRVWCAGKNKNLLGLRPRLARFAGHFSSRKKPPPI
jgi:hypothetical protein